MGNCFPSFLLGDIPTLLGEIPTPTGLADVVETVWVCATTQEIFNGDYHIFGSSCFAERLFYPG